MSFEDFQVDQTPDMPALTGDTAGTPPAEESQLREVQDLSELAEQLHLPEAFLAEVDCCSGTSAQSSSPGPPGRGRRTWLRPSPSSTGRLDTSCSSFIPRTPMKTSSRAFAQ